MAAFEDVDLDPMLGEGFGEDDDDMRIDFDKGFSVYGDDDLLGDDEILGAKRVSKHSAAKAVKKIVAKAAKERLPPPPLEVSDVIVLGGESEDDCVGDAFTYEIVGNASSYMEIIGADEDTVSVFGDDEVGDDGMFSASAGTPRHPLLRAIYNRIAASSPPPRRVRLDTVDSYANFLHGREHREDELGEAVAAPMTHVPLSLPPQFEGKIRCWRDGDEICCSIQLPGPDGQLRIATTGTPAATHAEEVVGYAVGAGVDPVDVLGVLPTVANILGGGSLVPQLAQVAPTLLKAAGKRGVPVSATIAPTVDPAVAALATMKSMCAKGDQQACDELAQIQEDADNGDERARALLADADAYAAQQARSVKKPGLWARFRAWIGKGSKK